MTANRSADLNVTGNSAVSSSPSVAAATRVVDVGDGSALRRRGRRPLPLGPSAAASGRSAAGVVVAVAAVGLDLSCNVGVAVTVVPLVSAYSISTVTAIWPTRSVLMHAPSMHAASEIVRDT